MTRAAPCHLQAIANSPEDFDLYIGRASAYVKSEDYMKAITDAKRAIELKPESFRGHMKKG